ncbi:MAG: hypothetical protein ABI678_02485 [Kofleriaceae bacterium]
MAERSVVRAGVGIGAVVAVWGIAWAMVIHTRFYPAVSIAAAVDFVITGNLVLWWAARGHVPRWVFGATTAIGLLFARAAIGRTAGGGHLVLALGMALEGLLLVTLVVRVRTARAGYRAAKRAGEGALGALVAALEAIRMPPRLAAIVATEVHVFVMAIAGWRRPRTGAFTVHRTNGWPLYAGVFAFLILAEAGAVHVALASWVSPIAAWIATALSIYSAIWFVGEAHALRHGGVLVTPGELRLQLGIRARARIPRSAIVSIEPVTDAGTALDLSILGANTLVRLNQRVRIARLFGRVRETDVIALSIDDLAGFQLALAEPLTIP